MRERTSSDAPDDGGSNAIMSFNWARYSEWEEKTLMPSLPEHVADAVSHMQRALLRLSDEEAAHAIIEVALAHLDARGLRSVVLQLDELREVRLGWMRTLRR